MPVRTLWIAVGLVATGLGVAGIFLPLLPTTPFLLLASFAFARGSPRLHAWLVAHPRLGPVILEWQRHGAIRRRVKVVALGAMALSLFVTWMLGFAFWIIGSQALVLGAVAIFIVTRPEPPAR
ncbi:YbaN family protein [Devosia sp.]|uniref:YbaN family protein n=1 Tax=Devosia sp. TaxID=1871048 RepID=UPI002EDE4497